MSKLASRLILSGLVSTLLVSCAATPLTQVVKTGNPAVVATSMAPPSQAQLEALQLKIDEDETFSESLIKDPKAALKTQGISLAESEKVNVLPVGSKLYLVLDDRNLKTFHANLLNSDPASRSDLQRLLDAVREKANSDAAFKAKLLSNTVETLKAEGIDAGVADLFQVVDYQPNTSLLLLPSAGGEITRGVGQDIVKYFVGLPSELYPIVENAVNALIKIANAADRRITRVAVNTTSTALAKGGETLCGLVIPRKKSSAFVCNSGKETSFYSNGIYQAIRTLNYVIDEAINIAIEPIQRAIDAAKKDIALIEPEIKAIQARLDNIKDDASDNAKKLREDLQKKLQDLLTRKNTLDAKLVQLLKDLVNAQKSN